MNEFTKVSIKMNSTKFNHDIKENLAFRVNKTADDELKPTNI